MTDEILTTAQTAKLLGVSVRTAQLLIEGGSLPSWKTPGGHRRVYRRDVEAIITDGPDTAPRVSARVLVLARGALRDELATATAALGEFQFDFAENASAALLAVGERGPAAIIAEAEDPAAAAAFVATILAETDIAPDHIIIIAPGADRPGDVRLDGVRRVTSPEEAVAALRESLADPPEAFAEASGWLERFRGARPPR